INWGDGTPSSTGTISGPNGSGVFTVTGNHTYVEEGIKTIAVNVNQVATSQSWSTVASLPTARQWPGVAAGADGGIYVIGGYDSSLGYTNTVYAYTLSTNSWAQVANMPVAGRYGLGATAGADGRIYAIGGYDPSLGGYTNTVYAYTPSSDSWAQIADL